MSSNCPHPTTRASGVCQQCSIERQFEGVVTDARDEHECPTCERPTARAEGECHRCRGADDECERCGNKQKDTTRVPLHDLDERLSVCGRCEKVLRQLGRVQRPVTDGGNAPEESETLQGLGRARMHVTTAITRSMAGEDSAVHQHLSTAARELRRIGLNNVAKLLEDLRDEEAPDYVVREDLRQLAQLFDAWAQSTIQQFTEQYQLRAGEVEQVGSGP